MIFSRDRQCRMAPSAGTGSMLTEQLLSNPQP